MESSNPILFAPDGTAILRKITCSSCPNDVELIADRETDGHYVCPECGLVGERLYQEDLFAQHSGGAHAHADKLAYQIKHGVEFRKAEDIKDLETTISSRSFHRNSNSSRQEEATLYEQKFAQQYRISKGGREEADNGNTKKTTTTGPQKLSQVQAETVAQHGSDTWNGFFRHRIGHVTEAVKKASVVLGLPKKPSQRKAWTARVVHIVCRYIWNTYQAKLTKTIVKGLSSTTSTEASASYELGRRRRDFTSLLETATTDAAAADSKSPDWDDKKTLSTLVASNVTTLTKSEALNDYLLNARVTRNTSHAYLTIAVVAGRYALGEQTSSLVPWRLIARAINRRNSTMRRYEMRIVESLNLHPWTRLEFLIGQCLYYLGLFPALADCTPTDLDAMRAVRHVYTAKSQTAVARGGGGETREGYKQCIIRISAHFDDLILRLRATSDQRDDNNNGSNGKRVKLTDMQTTRRVHRKMPHQDRIVTAVIAYLILYHRLRVYKFRHAQTTQNYATLAKDLGIRHENFCSKVKMELPTFRACLQNLVGYIVAPVVPEDSDPQPSSNNNNNNSSSNLSGSDKTVPMWIEGTAVDDFGG